MKIIVVLDTDLDEPNIDADTLGNLIVSIPKDKNLIDMDDIYKVCKKYMFPDTSESELTQENRREMFKLFADIWFQFAFCNEKDYIFTFKGLIVPEVELDQMFQTIFVPPRFLLKQEGLDLIKEIQDDTS